MKTKFQYLLVLLLSCFYSCSINKHIDFEREILKKESLSKRKYFVNHKILLQEDELLLIGYNVRLINGLVPDFVDGELFKLVLKTKYNMYFFNDIESDNIKLLDLLKGQLKNKEAITKVDTYYEDYNKGYVLIE